MYVDINPQFQFNQKFNIINKDMADILVTTK